MVGTPGHWCDKISPPDDSHSYPTRPRQSSETQPSTLERPAKRAHSSQREGFSKKCRRGRPNRTLPAEVKRCLVRLFVKTGEKLTDIFEAVKQSGGPEHQWTRKLFEGLTNTGPDTDLTLAEVRLRDKDFMHVREHEQTNACDKYTAEIGRTGASSATYGPLLPTASNEPASCSTKLPAARSAIGYPDKATDNVLQQTYLKHLAEKDRSGLGSEVTKVSPSSTSTDEVSKTMRLSTERQRPCIEQSETCGQAYSPYESLRAREYLQKEATVECDTVPNEAQHMKKRRLSKAGVQISALLRHLNPNKKRLNWFVMRSLTVTESPAPSRVSTGISQVGTKWAKRGSDYERYYHVPKLVASVDGVLLAAAAAVTPDASAGEPVLIEPLKLDPSTATTLLMRARKDLKCDAEVVQQLTEAMSSMDPFHKHDYVSAQDICGATALHLATAYGYPGTCGFLLDHHARHRTKTHKGARPHEFAAPAERLAGLAEDFQAYAQIMLCREHVRNGQRPLAPQPVDKARGVPRFRGLRGRKKKRAVENRAQGQPGDGLGATHAHDHAYGRGQLEDRRHRRSDSHPLGRHEEAHVNDLADETAPVMDLPPPASCAATGESEDATTHWLPLSPVIMPAERSHLGVRPRAHDSVGTLPPGYLFDGDMFYETVSPPPGSGGYPSLDMFDAANTQPVPPPPPNSWLPTYESLYPANEAFRHNEESSGQWAPSTNIERSFEQQPPDFVRVDEQQGRPFVPTATEYLQQQRPVPEFSGRMHHAASYVGPSDHPYDAFNPPTGNQPALPLPQTTQGAYTPRPSHETVRNDPNDDLVDLDAWNPPRQQPMFGQFRNSGYENTMYDPNGIPWPDWPDSFYYPQQRQR